MNLEVNYDDEVERKNTYPKLLSEPVEMMMSESVELLAKAGVTSASQKKRSGDPTVVVPATKRVTFTGNRRFTVGVC